LFRVALVTCASLPELDPDDQLLLEPLRALGVDATAAVWDSDQIDWDAFDLVVIRNTWDYPARRPEFIDWARRVARLANPADVVEWNTDKSYLADLAAAAVPTIPTTYLSPTLPVSLPTAGRHVLKPSVGAGSLDAAAFSMGDTLEARRANAHANRLLDAGKTVVVQPYMQQIEERGETALMYVGGEFSHAIVKGAMLAGDHGAEAGGLYLAETIASREPTPAELEIGRRALAAVAGGSSRLLYARVDLVPDANGDPMLMELELTEPSLYLRYGEGAAERFAKVIAG
jgi:glutathione synthase/RimK-type ligase-like ATP-grasp enzyme